MTLVWKELLVAVRGVARDVSCPVKAARKTW